MKNILTLKEKYMIEKGLSGLLWIIIGVFQLINLKETFRIMLGIVILICLFISFIPYFIKTEQEDEMSIYNNSKAKLFIYDTLIIAILFCISIAMPKGKWMIDLNLVLPFVLGVINLLEFILFIFYEKVGDKYGKTKNKNS